MTIIDANQIELELGRKLFWLVKHDLIFFGSYNENKQAWDDGTYPAIVCNDIFVGGADAEPLHLEDVDNFIEVANKYPRFAEYAWCIAKRNQKPWRHASTPDELEAVEFTCKLLNVSNPLVGIS